MRLIYILACRHLRALLRVFCQSRVFCFIVLKIPNFCTIAQLSSTLPSLKTCHLVIGLRRIFLRWRCMLKGNYWSRDHASHNKFYIDKRFNAEYLTSCSLKSHQVLSVKKA